MKRKRDKEKSAKPSEDEWRPEFPGQHRDEQIELVFRQHPVVMRKTLLAALGVAAVGELPLLVLPPSMLSWGFKTLAVGWLVAVLIIGYRWIGYHYSVYILTDKRLID